MLVNLKGVIAARRLTQVDFALSLKIAPSVLSEIIRGRRKADPSLRVRIAEALRAEETWLFSSVLRIPAPASRKEDSKPAPAACAPRDGS